MPRRRNFQQRATNNTSDRHQLQNCHETVIVIRTRQGNNNNRTVSLSSNDDEATILDVVRRAIVAVAITIQWELLRGFRNPQYAFCLSGCLLVRRTNQLVFGIFAGDCLLFWLRQSGWRLFGTNDSNGKSSSLYMGCVSFTVRVLQAIGCFAKWVWINLDNPDRQIASATWLPHQQNRAIRSSYQYDDEI